jgi:hypothetical protein
MHSNGWATIVPRPDARSCSQRSSSASQMPMLWNLPQVGHVPGTHLPAAPPHSAERLAAACSMHAPTGCGARAACALPGRDERQQRQQRSSNGSSRPLGALELMC